MTSYTRLFRLVVDHCGREAGGEDRKIGGVLQPAKIEMLPVSARWHLPETGQSTGSPPSASTFAPSRRISAADLLDDPRVLGAYLGSG